VLQHEKYEKYDISFDAAFLRQKGLALNRNNYKTFFVTYVNIIHINVV